MSAEVASWKNERSNVWNIEGIMQCDINCGVIWKWVSCRPVFPVHSLSLSLELAINHTKIVRTLSRGNAPPVTSTHFGRCGSQWMSFE